MLYGKFAIVGATNTANVMQGIQQMVILIGLSILLFYFILYKPDQKKRKQAEEKRNALKKGDNALSMGIVGTVDQVKKETIVLKMIDGSKIECLKEYVTPKETS